MTTVRLASGYSFSVEMSRQAVRQRLEASLAQVGIDFETTAGDTVTVYRGSVEILHECQSFYGARLVARGTSPEAPRPKRIATDGKGKK